MESKDKSKIIDSIIGKMCEGSSYLKPKYDMVKIGRTKATASDKGLNLTEQSFRTKALTSVNR